MLDIVEIKVKGGKGGNGKISGRREKFVPEGGPDGGDGGSGGSIYAVCETGVNTLISFSHRKKFIAEDGLGGQGGDRHGRDGHDIYIVVPMGTEVRELNKEKTLIADMSVPEKAVILAKGGDGGKGNARFSSATNQFPLIAEEGDPGQQFTLSLELKLLADVGIVGAPNAGKSSLISAVTRARPKIAEYEFTSLTPTLGVVDHRGSRFVMVDVPGLIEGAHEGAGLGHDFLRHIGRTRVMIHVLDGTSENIVGDYNRIRNELELYDSDLASKPEIIAINKIDLPDVKDRCIDAGRDLDRNIGKVHYISAVGRQGLTELLDSVAHLLDANPPSPSGLKNGIRDVEGEVPVLRPKAIDKPQAVCKQGSKYVVTLRAAVRLAAMLDQTNLQARAQMYEQLRKLGVSSALENAGIKAGETFTMGEGEWEWEG